MSMADKSILQLKNLYVLTNMIALLLLSKLLLLLYSLFANAGQFAAENDVVLR